MKPKQLNYDVMNDDARWAHPYEYAELLFAGIWFLYELMLSRYPKCQLIKRTLRLGNQFEQVFHNTKGDAARMTRDETVFLFSELDTIGTLGYSLWHLRDYLDAPGIRYELKELSQLGSGENPQGDLLRLRGQGFLLLAAANLSKQGFFLEFIPRRKDEKTPDFFARRDNNKFSCEVTNRYPQSGDVNSIEFFWSTINDVVDRKKRQLANPEFRNGVLSIDCTPVWDAFGLGRFMEGGGLVYYIPPELGGPRSGSVPLITTADPESAEGMRNFSEIARKTGIHNLILWKHRTEILERGYRRETMYRVVGTLDGAAFWSYFEKALVFPDNRLKVHRA